MLQMPLFGVVGYRRMLADLAAAGYRMRPTEDIGTRERSVFMRHDVDCHLDGIIAFARLEREMGCRSTWFVPVTRTREDLRRQIRVLENASGFKVRSVTSHKPGSLESRVDTSDWRVPIHPEYVSDSGRRWRDDRLMRLTHSKESFMLLTHVEHWLSAEQSLTGHFAASLLPSCTRQSADHAVEVLTDCLSHDA
jgi:hypothetical protein